MWCGGEGLVVRVSGLGCFGGALGFQLRADSDVHHVDARRAARLNGRLSIVRTPC